MGACATKPKGVKSDIDAAPASEVVSKEETTTTIRDVVIDGAEIKKVEGEEEVKVEGEPKTEEEKTVKPSNAVTVEGFPFAAPVENVETEKKGEEKEVVEVVRVEEKASDIDTREKEPLLPVPSIEEIKTEIK